VGALRAQSHQNHEARKGKKPLIRIDPGSFRSASDEAEVATLGEIVNVLDANAREAGNFRIGENLLARLDRDHGLAPKIWAQLVFSLP